MKYLMVLIFVFTLVSVGLAEDKEVIFEYDASYIPMLPLQLQCVEGHLFAVSYSGITQVWEYDQKIKKAVPVECK